MPKTKIPRVVGGRDLIREANYAFDVSVISWSEVEGVVSYATPSYGLPIELLESKSKFLSNFQTAATYYTTTVSPLERSWHESTSQLRGEDYIFAHSITANDWQQMVTTVTRLSAIDQLQDILALLSVPWSVNQQVLPLLDKATLEATRIVTQIIAERINSGLKVRKVRVEPLIDVDAGQWEEVIFTVNVDLKAEEANQEWDIILDRITEVTSGITDTDLSQSLREKIGIHFAWVTGSGI